MKHNRRVIFPDTGESNSSDDQDNCDTDIKDSIARRGPMEGACSMLVPAMSTRPKTSPLRRPSTHPAIKNTNHR